MEDEVEKLIDIILHKELKDNEELFDLCDRISHVLSSNCSEKLKEKLLYYAGDYIFMARDAIIDKEIKEKIDSIIFDLDGTLWNAVEATYKAALKVIEENKYSFKISREQIILGMGKTRKENAKIYMPNLEENSSLKVLDQINNKRKDYIVEKNIIVYDGVIETLNELCSKYELFIVSNCGEGYIEKFLDFTNTNKCFVDHIAAGELNITKSEAILKIISKYNLENPIYIGDTIKDKEAAEEARIPFIHAKYGFQQKLKSNISINKFDDLINIL